MYLSTDDNEYIIQINILNVWVVLFNLIAWIL